MVTVTRYKALHLVKILSTASLELKIGVGTFHVSFEIFINEYGDDEDEMATLVAKIWRTKAGEEGEESLLNNQHLENPALAFRAVCSDPSRRSGGRVVNQVDIHFFLN